MIYTLRVKTLVCHCGDHEHCHGDVFVKYAEAREPVFGAEDDATSDEEANRSQSVARVGGTWTSPLHGQRVQAQGNQ